jgi:hypothetical protein
MRGKVMRKNDRVRWFISSANRDPNVFRLNDDRQSEAVDPAGDPFEKVMEAAENCPMSAIIVEDADTGEQLFP